MLMVFLLFFLYSLDVTQVPHNILFMFSFLNFIIFESQLELAILIRVKNLSQTATALRKKLHRWDLRSAILNDKI
jgi:hypothetical protein